MKLSFKVEPGYRMTAGERNNAVYLILKYSIEWNMRAADLAVIETLIDAKLEGEAQMTNLIEVTSEYAWDHILGEPHQPKAAEIADHAVGVIGAWWESSTQAERDSTA